MASLQSNCTSSFKHHLRQARHAWSLYIVRTSTIYSQEPAPKPRFASELYLRPGTYDRPKNTLAIDSACAPLNSALAIDAPGAVEPLVWHHIFRLKLTNLKSF